MASLGEVRAHAAKLFAQGMAEPALRLYDAVVSAAPLDYESRIRVADCLNALGDRAGAAAVYRATAKYCLKSGHPLPAMVCARVLEAHGADASDLTTALVMHYGTDSDLVGKMAARVAAPPPTTEIPLPDLRTPAPPDLVSVAGRRATICTENFKDWPEAVHAIPLLSAMSEAAFKRVLSTLIVRRLPDGAFAIREGEAGTAFYFVAGGALRVFSTDGLGRQTELAQLHEHSIFGEMALLSAQPRLASVQAIGEADLLEAGRDSLAALADELSPVAEALHGFTRERLLANLMATSPLFKPFSRAQQRDLLRRFTSHDVAAQTVIINEGEEGRGLFVVLSGELDVSRAADGRAIPLATLKPGEVFGEMALLRGGPTTATVVASRASTVLYLAREVVARLVAASPEIRNYLEALADDREVDNRLAVGDLEVGEDERILI
jgi:CRP-like cAMP-binding protein